MEDKLDKILQNQDSIQEKMGKIEIGLYGDKDLNHLGAIKKADIAYSFTKKAKWAIRTVWGAVIAFFTWLFNEMFS